MATKNKKIIVRSSVLVGSLLVLAFIVFFYHKAEQAKADSFLPSDFNQDGIVDTNDIELIKQNYANTAGGILNPSPYDLNSDHKINSLDLAIVEDNQGNGTDPSRDWDADGYSVEEGDCADRDKKINPIAEEKADQIDNNCNGQVDDWVDYKPLSSRDVYVVAVHFHSESSGPQISVTSVEQKTLDTEYANTITYGEYAVVVSDSQHKVLDMAPFGNCLQAEALTPIGGETKNMSDCDQYILIPKTDQISFMEIKSLKGDSTSIPVAFTTASIPLTKEAHAEVNVSNCPPEIQKYVGACLNAQYANPLLWKYISTAFDVLSAKMPFLTMVPERTLALMPDHACGSSSALLCQTNGGNIEVNMAEVYTISDQDVITTILAHELSHYIEFIIYQYDGISAGGTYDDLYKQQIAKMYRYIDEVNCDFDPKKCILKPYELIAEWRDYVLRRPPTGLKVVLDEYLIWENEYNPSTKKFDPVGPRPESGIGLLREYGVKSERERWATHFEGLAMDTLAQDYLSFPNEDQYPNEVRPMYMSSMKSIFKANPPYPDTTELTNALKIFGKYGLIKDWDHDGVPDDYDNCSPRTYAGICKPGEMDACHNPNQEDFVNRAGNTVPDGIGDKCEFQGESLSFVTCYKGVIPPVSFASPRVPNCPDWSNPDAPGGYCTSPRILTAIGGVGLFSGNETDAKKAICEAAGEAPAE